MTDDDNLKEEFEVNKPHFKWKNYFRGLLVFLLDMTLLFAAALVVYAIIKHVVLQTDIDISDFNGIVWTKMVGHVVWPFALIVIVFVFRNPLLLLLYEAQGIIYRSYYRHGNKPPATPPGPNARPADPGKEMDRKEGVKHDLEADSCDGNREDLEIKYGTVDYEKAVQGVLAFFRKTMGGSLWPQKGIDRSKIYFDAVMQVGDAVYGIEVKTKANDIDAWRKVFLRTGVAHRNFSPKRQESFTFLACSVTREKIEEPQKNELRKLAENQQFNAEFRFFTYNGDGTVEMAL